MAPGREYDVILDRLGWLGVMQLNIVVVVSDFNVSPESWQVTGKV